MKVSFGNQWLATGDTQGASGLTVNGQQVNDEAQFFRALASTFFARGNRSAVIGFAVALQPGSIRLAERTVLTAFWDLPQQDDLRFYCGPDSDQEVILFAGAVPDAPQFGPTVGTSLQVRYSFRVSAPVTEDPPANLPEPNTDMFKRGTVAIAAAADHVDVAFAVAFAAPPGAVIVSIQRPGGGDQLWAILRDGSVTAAGFTADLSAPAPDGTYKLSWVACA